jgi:hypothetical protein
VHTVRRALAGLSLLFATILVVPATASAGTYIDWECAGPGGAPVAANGFTKTETANSSAVNTCGTAGGQLSAGLTSGASTGGQGASWNFAAPPDTNIAAVTVDRSTTGGPSTGSLVTYQIAADNDLIDGCLPATCTTDVSGQVSRSNLAAANLLLAAGCGALGVNPCSVPLRLNVTRAAISLRDDLAPTVGNIRGSLFAAAAKSGTATVEFDAADRGGGVYRMVTTIDDKLFEIQPAAFGTCTDIDPSNSNPYEFPARVPCPYSQAGLSVAIDTTKLSEGRHSIGVNLEDAAGNVAAVVAAGTRFTVRNARPNGSPAGRTRRGRVRMFFAENRETAFSSVVGQRVVTRGFLRDNRGRGIRGAEVEVYHYVAGKRRLLKTGLRSRRNGRLTLILPLNLFGDARGRRRIAFYYRASVPGPVTSRANLFLTIRNRAGGPQSSQPGD